MRGDTVDIPLRDAALALRLVGAVGFVFVIATVNIALLLLTRGAGRA